MNKIPETKKTDLEKANIALLEEIGRWEALGIDHNNTVHTNASVFDFKIKFMALSRVVMEKLGITDEEMNLAYTEIVVEEMKTLRTAFEMQKTDSDVTIPKLGILGPDGKPIVGF